MTNEEFQVEVLRLLNKISDQLANKIVVPPANVLKGKRQSSTQAKEDIRAATMDRIVAKALGPNFKIR
jgi:hypothetical protein